MLVAAVLALVLAAGVVTVLVLPWRRATAAAPTFETPYQAVVLTNGTVYFGKLQGFGSAYPTLTEVYYVRSDVNRETQERSNLLLQRGREWHGPTRMVLNATHILLVENVDPKSKVSELIDAIRSGRQPQ